MTKETPTFNISEFELRDYTNPYLTPQQATDVADAEERVNSQLDFLAQMLGWNGPNYWGNLPETVDQKRQLLGGTFGVYNSYIIPRVYEVRNWDGSIVVDRLQFFEPGRRTQISRIQVGDNTYRLGSVSEEGDKYVITLVGGLTDDFLTAIEGGTPIQIDIPTYRSAPFYRPSVGISGDYQFTCGVAGSSLTLYPAYDGNQKFPFLSPVLFAGSVYYFNKPVYLATSSALAPTVASSYDNTRNLWYLQVPESLENPAGITAYLAVAQSNVVESLNASIEVLIQPWNNPSDWGNENVLNNFRGTWGNKGGDLPFNFVFDSLSLHGFDETQSVYLSNVEKSLNFNDIVNFIYYQRTTIANQAPGSANYGDLWWNDDSGVLSVWVPNNGCGSWVQIDYRNAPTQTPAPAVTYADVTAFRAGSGSLPVGTIVRINDVTGLDISDNVIGVQGTLNSPAWLTLHRETSAPYWTPDEFGYLNLADFSLDSSLLPYGVPVSLLDATGLSPDGGVFKVNNLSITVTGDYEVLLIKYYNNTTWEIYPDSILKYIAYSALFGGPLQGQMWWDFVNTDPNTRRASIYYETAWVGVNTHPSSGPPTPVLDLGVVLFYCDGVLLTDGVTYTSEDFYFTYESDTANGKYDFSYVPRTFKGRVQLPTITISDSLTTTYRADITDLVFSGITYKMSPNLYNAESPLRLWKAEALQVADTLEHLAEDNYINPLLADVNNGPGPENWEKYFVRLPLEYGRNETAWQKVALTCRDFAYWGSTIEPEAMRCPPEESLPVVYEELFLYGDTPRDYTYVYSEPYLYSNVAYPDASEAGEYQNAGVFPTAEVQYDEFFEAVLIDYDPLHNRKAFTGFVERDKEITEVQRLLSFAPYSNEPDYVQSLLVRLLFLTSKVYGDWEGIYVNVNPCTALSGYLVNDVKDNSVDPVEAPIWDASIYKFAPTCANEASSYSVDANHYKIGYAYFVADASAAEDTFFDVTKEASWRYPVEQPRTLYLTPR